MIADHKQAIASLPRDRLLAEFSLWSADLVNIERDIRRIESFADLHHVDVADGRFTPGYLFFPDLVAQIARLTQVPIHAHLMVEPDCVEAQTEQFIEAGVSLISVHAENGEASLRALGIAAKAGVVGGIVVSLETPLDAVEPFLPHVAMVTLMGTRIGVKGQSLAPEACSRVTGMRRILTETGRPDVILAADGGIRANSVPDLRAAGAQTVVLGSLAFGDPDLAGRIAWLHGLPGPTA